MNLRKVFHVAVYEYRTNARRWGYRLVTFGLPLLGAVLLLGIRALKGHANVGAWVAGSMDKPVAVYDQGNFLPHDATLPTPFVLVDDVREARQAVSAGKFLALLVLPTDLTSGQKVTAVVRENNMTVRGVIFSRLQTLMLYAELRKAYPAAQALRLAEGPDVQVVALGNGNRQTTHPQEEGSSRFMVGYALSILFFIALFSSAGYLLQSVAKEKESHIMELLLSSVTAMELLWGKVIGLAALAATQVVVWLLSLWALGGLALRSFPQYDTLKTAMTQLRHPDPQLLIALLVVMPLSYLAYGLLMAGLGSLGSNLRESQQFSAAISMLAALPFMLNFLFFLNPNGIVPRFLSYFPWTAPAAVLLRLAIGPIPWWDLGVVVFTIAVGAAFSLWAGVRLFRVGVLMSGKKPSWREVWTIVRNPA